MAHTAPTHPSTHAAPHGAFQASGSASCPAPWRPAAWLWLLLVLPGLLASGTASALNSDGPTSRSVDHPAMVLVRDLPGHLLAQPSGDADDTSALSAPIPRSGVPRCALRIPPSLVPAQASGRQHYPGNPRAPPSLI